MARPLRLEYPGAVYHVMARGNNRQAIFIHQEDYDEFKALLALTHERFCLQVYAYCLMGNHYHLLVETPNANLQKALQYINSAYSISYNRRHKRVGHVLQGRYKAVLVEKEPYLLELTRYIHLNPVKAKLTTQPGAYPWSSYRAYVGEEQTPKWLNAAEVLNRFGQSHGARAYRRFVEDRMDEKVKENPLLGVVYQCMLGGKHFVDRMKSELEDPGPDVLHRKSLLSADPGLIKRVVHREGLDERLETKLTIYMIRRYCDWTLQKISNEFGGGHYSRIAQMVKRLEGEMNRSAALKKAAARVEASLSNVKT